MIKFKNIASVKNRSILREMVATDFRVRYQGSVLGYAWSVLRPLFLFAILYVVFVKFLKVGNGIPHFPVYLLSGIILWTFFVEATSSAMSSIVGRGDLIKKINIPRYLVVLSSLFSALINLFLNLIILFIFAIISHVPLQGSWLLIPLLIIELFMLSLSLGFILSALFVKYRDASYIWEVLLQGGFYATPILYPLARIPFKFQKYLMLNPVAQIVQDFRWCFVTHQTTNSWNVSVKYFTIFPILIIIILIIVATKYFKAQSPYFAENI